ncbi:MAG: hypothetical protein M3264_03250 [Thermoproteota archaeon]|nr:hypothetical protein [Thermoproteota archaeon]
MKVKSRAPMKCKVARVMIETSKTLSVCYVAKDGDTTGDHTRMIWLWSERA